MSSRPAPQPSSRQAAPTQRQAPQSGTSKQTGSGSSQRQDTRNENQGQRQDARNENQNDRQDYAEDTREDRQDYYDDWDDHWYHDDDYGEALVVGVAVGAVVAAADYDDEEVTTVTNVTNVTNVTALASLPCEARITVSNGVNYYQCGSNWYTRAYQGDVVVYVPGGPPAPN
ncbi:MAG: hypothetical protein WBC37_07025 [Burkholderiaceae bacterium]